MITKGEKMKLHTIIYSLIAGIGIGAAFGVAQVGWLFSLNFESKVCLTKCK